MINESAAVGVARLSTRQRTRVRVAHVSTFPPLRCGIANFASDLIASTNRVEHSRYALHYGSLQGTGFAGDANVLSIEQVVALAKRISEDEVDVVNLQHEFGIWGHRGENLVPFLDNLTKPILSVLHTSFGPGVRDVSQADMLTRLIDRSSRVVVLTDTAKRNTSVLVGKNLEKLLVIPHGVPDLVFADPPGFDRHAVPRSPFRLVTPGFFREDKGFEVILGAITRLRSRGHTVLYLIAGEPQKQFARQRDYHAQITETIGRLDLNDVVRVDCRYLSVQEQVSVIQRCHAGVFAYQEPAQSSSGTVPLVMGAGRPVIATPFEFAQARAAEGPGLVLSAAYDEASLADAIERAIERVWSPELAWSIYGRARAWVWSSVANRFADEFEQIAATQRPAGA